MLILHTYSSQKYAMLIKIDDISILAEFLQTIIFFIIKMMLRLRQQVSIGRNVLHIIQKHTYSSQKYAMLIEIGDIWILAGFLQTRQNLYD